jgi:hypothetical protein
MYNLRALPIHSIIKQLDFHIVHQFYSFFSRCLYKNDVYIPPDILQKYKYKCSIFRHEVVSYIVANNGPSLNHSNLFVRCPFVPDKIHEWDFCTRYGIYTFYKHIGLKEQRVGIKKYHVRTC